MNYIVHRFSAGSDCFQIVHRQIVFIVNRHSSLIFKRQIAFNRRSSPSLFSSSVANLQFSCHSYQSSNLIVVRTDVAVTGFRLGLLVIADAADNGWREWRSDSVRVLFSPAGWCLVLTLPLVHLARCVDCVCVLFLRGALPQTVIS